MRGRIIPAVGFILAWSLTSFGTYAQEPAAAKALFDRAQQANKRGQREQACQMFAESLRMYPRPSARFEVAECLREEKKLATASIHYQDYVREVNGLSVTDRLSHHDRLKKAEVALAALERDIPRLTLVLPAGAPAGTVVTRDGTILTEASLGVPIPVDLGEHVVTTLAPGGTLHSETFSMDRGAQRKVELKVIGMPPPPPPLPQQDGTTPAEAKATQPDTRLVVPPHVDAAKKKPKSGLRIGGVVALGVGGVGLAMWGVTGGLALSKKSDVDANCTDAGCSQSGIDAQDQGRTFANVATAGLVVGGVGLATGLALLIVGRENKDNGPAKPAVQVAVIEAGPVGAVLGVKGAF